MNTFSLIVVVAGYLILGLCLIETIRQVRELNHWKKDVTELCKASVESEDA